MVIGKRADVPGYLVVRKTEWRRWRAGDIKYEYRLRLRAAPLNDKVW